MFRVSISLSFSGMNLRLYISNGLVNFQGMFLTKFYT